MTTVPFEHRARPSATMTELWFEIEARCNLRCQFCYNPWRPAGSVQPAALSTGEAITALKRCIDALRCRKVVFSGGEPLLRDDLEEIVRVARDRGARCVVTTNGTLLTPDRAKSLIDAGVGLFQVPVLSHDPAVHDELSGRRCFRDVIGNLILARDLEVPIVPIFVATRKNISDLLRVLKLCYVLQCTIVVFNRFLPGGLGLCNRDLLNLDDDALVGALQSAETFAAAHGMKILLGTPVPGFGACHRVKAILETDCPVDAGRGKPTLSPSGSLRQCTQTEIERGNVLDEDVGEIVVRLGSLDTGSGNVLKGCRFECREELQIQ
jgi:MoaA/NifB/PqqE/SkfB family radical SAM enzyme